MLCTREALGYIVLSNKLDTVCIVQIFGRIRVGNNIQYILENCYW